MNIGEYLPSGSRGKYSPIFTEPEANNCFSIISELKNRENFWGLHLFSFRIFPRRELEQIGWQPFLFLRVIITALRGEYNAIVRIAQPIRLLKTRSSTLKLLLKLYIIFIFKFSIHYNWGYMKYLRDEWREDLPLPVVVEVVVVPHALLHYYFFFLYGTYFSLWENRKKAMIL